MAKTILTTDLTKGLQDATTEAGKLLGSFEAVLLTVTNTATILSNSKKNLNLADAKDIEKLNKIYTESNKLQKQRQKIQTESEKLQKQQLDATKKLNAARKKEGQEIDRTKQLTREANQLRRAEAVLNDRTSGTLERLNAQNTRLRLERQKLNLETEKGRQRLEEINRAINKNNDAIKKNSDQLKKQKLNVGNYTASTKDAIIQTGFFSAQVAQLQRIQAILNIFLKKNTQETAANAAATKGAAAANGGLTKGLKFLKIALISTGVGAIVVALGSLIAAFASTQRGADAFTKVIEPLKAVFEVFVGFLQKTAFKVFDNLKAFFNDPKEGLINLVKKVGDSIKDNLINRFKALGILSKGIISLLKGDFKKGFKELGEGALQLGTGVEDLTGKVKTFAEETSDSLDKATRDALALGKKIADLNIQLEKDQIDAVVPIAKARLEFQKLRGIAQDQLATDKERIQALKDAEKQQRFINQKEKELLDTKIQIQVLENTKNDTPREAQLELQKLLAQRLQAEERAAKKINGLISLRSGIEKKAESGKQKGLKDTEKFVNDLNKTFENNEFEQKVNERTERFIETQKKIKENEVIDEAIKIELLLKLNIQYRDDLTDLSKEQADKDKKAAEDSLNEEIKLKQRSLKEIELASIRAGDSELVRAKKISDQKIKLLQDEIAARKAAGQDTLDLELNLAKEIDRINKSTDAQRKADAEATLKVIKDNVFAVSEAVLGGLVKQSNARQQNINEEIQESKNRRNELIRLSSSTDSQTSQIAAESLAKEREIERQKTQELEKEKKKQIRLELLLSGLKAYQANAGQPNAAAKTIVDVGILVAGLAAAGNSFFEGTDRLGTNGKGIDSKGGMLNVNHPDEMIIQKDLNKKMGYPDRHDVAEVFTRYKNGDLLDKGVTQGATLQTVFVNSDNSEVVNVLKSVKKELRNANNAQLVVDTARAMISIKERKGNRINKYLN